MNEMCGDNRFEIIARAKKHLLDATNIDTSPKEMEVLDDFLFRCWQMGWLDRYDTADTPQTEETCERCVYVRGSQWCQGCNGTPKRWDGEKIVDTPQPDCKSCKQYGAVSVSCDRCDKSTHSNYEP